MKNLALLIATLFSTFVFSQAIVVNTTNYSVPQLVNEVLINSPCVSATNIKWSTGSNFGSSNGIGYFQNTNPNFPIKSGVILSTGNVLNAFGPNTSVLSDGAKKWLGDTDLEKVLADAGIALVSKNASVLEFDFTPISKNFNFDFLFASEEYGNFQCNYSDSFAFLLTDTTTGITKNLAVVPKTNDPISVVTIRNNDYNSSCTSVNPDFFGSYNGGTKAATSATNFNGQTTVLTASSALIPGVTYHIKLVIADRLDTLLDSAIFLSSNSFNIGQEVLGLDLTVANDNAVCFGGTQTLNTNLNSTDYSFSWKKDGVVIPGETGSTLTINKPGVYSVTYDNLTDTCIPFTDSILIEYYPEIVLPDPNNLYRCDTGASSYLFNLDLNTSVIKNNLNPLAIVSYHLTSNDASNNLNPLPLQYTGTDKQTIYTRVQLPNTTCPIIKPFQLLLVAPPVAFQPKNMSRCTKVDSDVAVFNLSTQTKIILHGQSPTVYSVSYYNSSDDANNATNPITNITSGSYHNQTIFARLQNDSDPICYSVTSFDLIVNAGVPVDKLDNVTTCTEYILPQLTDGNYFTGTNGKGTPLFAGDSITKSTTLYIFNQPDGPNTCAAQSILNITIIDPEKITPKNVTSCGNYTLPKLSLGKYFTEPGASGNELPAGTVIKTSKTIYFNLTTKIEPICTVDSSFEITILPSIEVGTRPDVFECTSYTLPELSLGNYYTAPDGTGNQLAAGTVLTSSQTIYVFASSPESPSCKDEDSFKVIIGFDKPADINQCDSYTLPTLPIGNYYTGPMGTGNQISAGTVINESTVIYIYVQSTSGNCTDSLYININISKPKIDVLDNMIACESYVLPSLINGEYFTGTEGSGVKLNPGDIILTSQTIYIYKKLNGDCYNQGSFVVTIVPLPTIDSRADIDICDQYLLTPLQNGEYYTEPGGKGIKLSGGAVITSSQKIYIYATNTVGCNTQSSFQVNVFSTTADAPQNVTACDRYLLPSLTTNNKYFTQSGGPKGTGVEILPGTIITTNQTIYVFKETQIRTDFSCTNENYFTITINKTPIIPSISDIYTCESLTLSPIAVGNYYTDSNGSGQLINAGAILTTNQTIYVFAHTATSPDCSTQKSFTVNIFNVDNLQNVTICDGYTLPNLTEGNYYTDSKGTGTMLSAGTIIKTSQTVYIYGISKVNPTCSDETMFRIRIVDSPIANSVPTNLRNICDEDGTNDGVTSFNLNTLTATILGNQTGSEFSIKYYENLIDATNQVNEITSSTSTTIYVRVNNTLTANCFDIKPISLYVNKLPEPTPADGIICMDSKTGKLINAYTIYSGLNTSTNTFVWTNETGNIIGHGNAYEAILPGVYAVTATSKVTGCTSKPVKATVSPSEAPSVTYSVSSEFTENQSITITATGQGNNFEYQLDNSQFQDSPVFENVTSGVHTINVRDKYGCGTTSTKAIAVNYPKFFTPNGDGINDDWNISDLSNQSNASILIFDRYGKMIKQLKPNSGGWDGTYNGYEVPSDDYWFTIAYTDENNENKEFKSHFSLKR